MNMLSNDTSISGMKYVITVQVSAVTLKQEKNRMQNQKMKIANMFEMRGIEDI